MNIQSIFPIVIFHIEKDKEVTMEKCIKALKAFKKQHGGRGLSKKSLENAMKYYEEILKEE